MSSKSKHSAHKAKKQKQRQAKIKQQVHVKKTGNQKTVAEEVHISLALIKEGNVSGGSRILERLRKKNDGEPLVMYGLGVLNMNKGQFRDAVSWFEQAVEKAPDHIEAHYNLAVAYQKTNDIPGMIMAYQHVIEKGVPDSYPVNKAAENLARLEQALQEREGIGLTEFIEGHLYFKEGLQHMGEKDWNEAIQAFHKAVQTNPKSIQSHCNLGICYAVLGQKKNALAAFDMALELNPDYELARVHRKQMASMDEGEHLSEKFRIDNC